MLKTWLAEWGWTLGKITVIWISGFLLVKVVHRTVQRTLDRQGQTGARKNDRRRRTIGKLAANAVTYTVNFLVILLILEQLGFSLMPLLAGVGVVGLAIGFGAQNLVRDVISGFFILFEDQFGVGDVIQTGNYKGTVEEIGLRTTRIRSWSGETHIIPNGKIESVTNYSQHNAVIVDVSVPYEADVDQAVQVIRDAMRRAHQRCDALLREPEVLGVQSLEENSAVIRLFAVCAPNRHFAAAKRLQEDVRSALGEAGIDAPYPRVAALQDRGTVK